MNPLIANLKNSTDYLRVIDDIKKSSGNVSIIGLSDSQKAHMICSIYNDTKKPVVIVCNNILQARKFIQDLQFFTQDQIIYFPARNIVYYDIQAQSRDIQNQRLFAIDNIMKGQAKIIVTTIDALTQKMMPINSYDNLGVHIDLNSKIDLEMLVQKLSKLGYQRSNIVDGKGQYTSRGGIVDIFPISSENPVRIEFFGDQIDSIRIFDLKSQRSIENIQNLDISYASEFLISKDDVKYTIDTLKNLIQTDINEDLKAQVEDDIVRLENDDIEESLIDKYFSLLVKSDSTLFDFLSSNNFNIFVDEPTRCSEKCKNIIYEANETLKMLADKNYLYMKYTNTCYTYGYFESKLQKYMNIYLQKLNINDNINIGRKIYTFSAKEINYVVGEMEILMKDLRYWQENGKIILLVYPSESKADMIKNQLIDNDIKNVIYIDNMFEFNMLEPSNIYITTGILSGGFIYQEVNLYVIAQPVSGLELSNKNKARKIASFGQKINSFDEINEGEYVVHENHGIGIYRGIHTVTVGNVKNDYIKIEYLNHAVLYVPITQLESVRKYIGDQDSIPKIDMLGSKKWYKTKAKAKSYVELIAKDLVLLYAKRRQTHGFAFSPDSPWQKEFEDTFKYELTPDQKTALEEIKKDMEQPIPMDRLLCGDVGYGKTEVALRAAFKAVMDQKQVAYLVPTTILCMQQYNTFKQRMEPFGVKVEFLSRFKTSSQQKQIIKDLASGSIDVIIGTHRILSNDIKYKDLGFLIIDEEHRFGVKAKESIKKLKESIDVLSMTATPIPRTLHMSMIGVRQMSTLTMPPLERMPVHTYVLEYDENVIKQAIEKELSRDGQIFYINNRVENIESVCRKVQKMVPEAKVNFAHGQMEPRQIEDIMYKFVNHELDVIVCTTILESGIDIPNANTLIIENADKMGLAQLYQIRGRVGRSNKLAYAYITYKKDKQISDIAEKRLKAIKDFTEFGSGFKIALRDLEIRGAGNLFGRQQHGHMVAIGYEMYLKMLEDAIKQQKGIIDNNFVEKSQQLTDVKIEVSVSAYINNNYINDLAQKIQAYQKISNIHSQEDATKVEEELTDRYGDIPIETHNLIKIMQIRNIARNLNISKIIQTKNYIIFEPINLKFHLTNNDNNDILYFIKIALTNLEKMMLKEKGN